MPYTPDPVDITQPLDTVEARTAAAEFRALKNYIQSQIRRLPAASVTTGAVIAADSGKCVYATGDVTLPNNVFAQGDRLHIYNTTASPIEIVAAVTTLRLAGTNSVGSRDLVAYGFATVVYLSATSAVIWGPGIQPPLDPTVDYILGDDSQVGDHAIGYRDIPPNVTGWARGECHHTTSNVTLDVSDCDPGFTFSIYNSGATPITITEGSGLTLRLAGTATTGNRTLAGYGLATIWCKNGVEAVITGAGVT